MKVNQTNIERIIRIIVGLALGILFITGTITGGWGIAAIIVGAVMLLTGGSGFCPLYTFAGIKSKE